MQERWKPCRYPLLKSPEHQCGAKVDRTTRVLRYGVTYLPTSHFDMNLTNAGSLSMQKLRPIRNTVEILYS